MPRYSQAEILKKIRDTITTRTGNRSITPAQDGQLREDVFLSGVSLDYFEQVIGFFGQANWHGQLSPDLKSAVITAYPGDITIVKVLAYLFANLGGDGSGAAEKFDPYLLNQESGKEFNIRSEDNINFFRLFSSGSLQGFSVQGIQFRTESGAPLRLITQNGPDLRIELNFANGTSAELQSNNLFFPGFTYAQDYSGGFLDRSLPDVAYVKSLLSASKILSISDPAILDNKYDVVILSGTFTQVLPLSDSITHQIIYKNKGAGTITLQRQGTDQIEDPATPGGLVNSLTLAAGDSYTLIPDQGIYYIG